MSTKRVAVVTGGMGGIGTEICQRLYRDGFVVVVGCTESSAATEEWLKTQLSQGFEFHQMPCDVSHWEDTVRAFSKVQAEVGPVDVLVNNAGITRDSTFRKMTVEQWTDVINTNLSSMFNTTKQVIDGMLERNWGRIINISSVNGQRGQFGQANYSAAKAGVHGLGLV